MDDTTIAILVTMLSWSWRQGEDVGPQPASPRPAVALESMRWQQLSAQAAAAEMAAYPVPFRRIERWNRRVHVIEAGSGCLPESRTASSRCMA